MPFSKKLFLTGGTGLIGKELLIPLIQAEFEVYALTIDKELPQLEHVHWLPGNLFDDTGLSNLFAQVKPQYLLNMAWCTTADYQTSNLNFDFVRAGLSLLKHFAKNGGKRAVFAGTCLEYAPQPHPLKESDPIAPACTYAYCKHALHLLADSFCAQNGISFAYGRIFYVYGKNEHPKRLTASIINQLKQGQKVAILHAQLQKDYLYTKDIAGAFTALLDSGVTGTVNICSGRPISLKEFASEIATQLCRADLLELQTQPTSQPASIVGDNSRLRLEVKFEPQYSLTQALKEILK